LFEVTSDSETAAKSIHLLLFTLVTVGNDRSSSVTLHRDWLRSWLKST